MSDSEHVVGFTAEGSCLVARCSCGWSHEWRPNTMTIQETDYGVLFAIGLEHTRKATAASE